VQVLDPNDDELRQRLARAVWQAVRASDRTVSFAKNVDIIARAVIEELRQP
jgi:hypothetical protein